MTAICINHRKYDKLQVAEIAVGNGYSESERELVGMVRGCIKTVTCGKKLWRNGRIDPPLRILVPVLTKGAYILGLRVSPSHWYVSYQYLHISFSFTNCLIYSNNSIVS